MSNTELPRGARRRKAFALWLTTALAPVFGFLYAGPTGAFWAFAAWIVFVVIPRTTGMRPFGFIHRNFFVPEQLPWTMVNVVLAILVGCLWIGIDVAFYAALIGVPVVVLMLIVAVLEPDVEAQAITVPIKKS